MQDISSTCSCALIRTTQKLTVVTQWLYDKQWKPRGQEDEIVWLANNALVAYVGVQLKQSFFFFNVCIVPYIKKAQLIRLLCDFLIALMQNYILSGNHTESQNGFLFYKGKFVLSLFPFGSWNPKVATHLQKYFKTLLFLFLIGGVCISACMILLLLIILSQKRDPCWFDFQGK